MKIVSIVLKYLPAHVDEVSRGVESVPGASVAVIGDDGRMIVVIEDGEGYAVSDSILAIHRVPHVMSVTLSYEYSDEGLALLEA